ncbi:MAG: sialate O-acetylesterase [Candidatus Methylacidiphilales bacterium]|nr:sialate O-acetylesterase [Candidatus Methylacidiphilales bacterium]
MNLQPTRLKPHPLFSSHAVLQQGQPNPVWGWGTPGACVTLSFRSHEFTTRVTPNKNWRIDLPPLTSHPGSSLHLTSDDECLILENVAVGEVWIGSGQSNMEWPLQFSDHAYHEIQSATDPLIRLFTVPRFPSLEPRATLPSTSWSPCSPESVRNFSAVAYFFGRKLRQELDVPVGLIHASWGGSAIQPWLPHHDASKASAVVDSFATQWRAWAEKECHSDPGNTGEKDGWAKLDYDDHDWQVTHLPGIWEAEGLDIDGAVWFRKELELPAHWVGRDLVLHFGKVDDFDTTYFNGEIIGGLDRRTALAGTTQRVYVVPGKLVRAGKNVLATRIFDHAGGGGMLADSPWHFTLILSSSHEQRFLAGEWRIKVENALPSKPGTIWASMPNAPLDYHAQFEPSMHRASLFNGMIAPLAPYGLRGVLWYQGESNAHEAHLYPGYLRELVEGWRAWWNDENLAFYIAQLADWLQGQDAVLPESRSLWSELREAQTRVLELPRTGLAVTRDLGDAYDIHPRNKQGVGLRLALQALKKTYGINLPADGPTPLSTSFSPGKVTLQFVHTDCGLQTSDGGPLRGFILGDAAGNFYQADARIVGSDRVEVSSSHVPTPTAVRYAWLSYSDANLENAAGLPAGPFRSDAPPFGSIS